MGRIRSNALLMLGIFLVSLACCTIALGDTPDCSETYNGGAGAICVYVYPTETECELVSDFDDSSSSAGRFSSDSKTNSSAKGMKAKASEVTGSKSFEEDVLIKHAAKDKVERDLLKNKAKGQVQQNLQTEKNQLLSKNSPEGRIGCTHQYIYAMGQCHGEVGS